MLTHIAEPGKRDRQGEAISIQFLGDIAPTSEYCNPIHWSAVRENMARVLERLPSADVRIGNWEAPLWGDGQVNELKKPHIATTDGAASCLDPLGLDVALLGNNHVYDCKEVGFDNTVKFLAERGIRTVGAGRTPQSAQATLEMEVRGCRIGIISCAGPETHPNLPPDASIHLHMIDPAGLKERTAELSEKVDVTVVCPHWGRLERVRFPSPAERCLGRSLVDQGATLVVGSHPHCLQGDEPWGSGHVFYSIGNFLFGPMGVRPGRTGLDWPRYCRVVGIPTVTLEGDQCTRVEWTFFRQEHLLMQPLEQEEGERLLRKLRVPLRMGDHRLERLVRKEGRRARRHVLQTAAGALFARDGFTGIRDRLMRKGSL